MFRNIAVRIFEIRTRSVLNLMALFYLIVVVTQLYFVFTVPYSADHKSPPKVLTDTENICRVNTINHHPISYQKILS